MQLGLGILNKRHTTESVLEYITEMLTMMRRYGKYTPIEQMEIIDQKFRPEYKLTIRERDFRNIYELIDLAQETKRNLTKTKINTSSYPGSGGP